MSTPYPADRFVDRLVAAGIDFFTGVPCSLVAPVSAELFDTPHREPTAESLEADVAWAAGELRRRGRPVALVVRPGLFDAAH